MNKTQKTKNFVIAKVWLDPEELFVRSSYVVGFCRQTIQKLHSGMGGFSP
jgi:hypothetical protein